MKKIFAILLCATIVAGCENDAGIYKVGDFYFENGKKGYVFTVSDGGLHGKIVSIDEERCRWSAEGADTGATDRCDGMNNMKAICDIEGWRDKYPAFAWCADKGSDWYLPAIDELKEIFDSGVVGFKNYEYWSSTEADWNGASWYMNMWDGNSDSGYKTYSNYVRAVSAF